MEGTIVLLLLVVLMLVGSYLIGSIPLVMPMSEVKFKDRKEVLHKLQSVHCQHYLPVDAALTSQNTGSAVTPL
jgi:hypothetical protein